MGDPGRLFLILAATAIAFALTMILLAAVVGDLAFISERFGEAGKTLSWLWNSFVELVREI